jgi:DNA-binding PadR family transcriptional regulator
MKRTWFFILLSLADGDSHGSGIMRDVLELTGGELRLWPATLYGALDELLAEGFIQELGVPEGESERKRYYGITAAGRRAAQAETRRLEQLVEVARTRTSSPRGRHG